MAATAWAAMLGLAVVTVAVKWNQPGFRQSDAASPMEMALGFAVFLAVPLTLMATMLSKMTAFADHLLAGRMNLAGNAVLGGSLGAINAVGFLAAGRLISDGVPWDASTLATFVPILAVGGVVMSLGMRRRSPL